jgi:Inovirus Gp2
MGSNLIIENIKNFERSTYALYQEGTEHECNKLEQTEDCFQARSIISIEQLVYEIIKCKEDVFCIGKNNFSKFILCNNKSIYDGICRYTIDGNSWFNEINYSFSIHKYSPYVQLFIRNFNEHNFFKGVETKVYYYNNKDKKYQDEEADKKLQPIVDALNNFINSIKKEADSQKFKTELYEHKRLINDNYKSLLKYIDRLFVKHSRLLVLRIDLGYKKDVEMPYLNEAERYAKYLQAKKDRENFFNNMRSNKLFKHILGYAWKLEFASRKGFHYHMLFFFDGSKVQQDITKARMIGMYWAKVITKGNGLYFNCNAKRNQYKYPGIGMIDRKDIELRQGLEIAAR